MVLYTVGGDESHDSQTERVFAVGGVFGSQVQWDLAEAAWVQRTGGKVFHAKDCESDQGDYAGIDHKENLALYKDLTQIVVKSDLIGFAAALDLVGSREFFPDNLKESPYHKCFFETVYFLTEEAYKRGALEAKVEFVFDQRVETNYSAGQLYDWMRSQTEWQCCEVLSEKLSFATRALVSIQIADLVTREAMKELDRLLSGSQKPMRKSMAALVGSRRFQFDFYVREYFEDFKKRFPMILERSGLAMENYHAWVREQCLTDCWTVRMKYARYVQATRLRKKIKKE